MKLIVGLGNPGEQYIGTRHNIGFEIVREFWSACQKKQYILSPWKYEKKFKADISKGEINGEKTIIALPQTFMNNSGQSVKELANFYKLNPENILIIHDDIDVILGKFKTQKNRGSAGHNGIHSVIQELGSKNFNRIRVGIKNPELMEKNKIATDKFVLNKFTKKESAVLKKIIEEEIIPTLF